LEHLSQSALLKRKSDFKCTKLPRKYPKRNFYSNRFGQTANEMQPLHGVRGLFPVTSPDSLPVANVFPAMSVPPKVHENNQKNQQHQATVYPINANNALTPPVTFVKACDLNKNLLQNGSHFLSLLQLKSLDRLILKGELAILKSRDPQFEIGWLYDEVINSYLWWLCQKHSHCLYVSAATVQVLEKGRSIKRLWDGISTKGKQFIFMPWNPTTTHWILLVIDLDNRKLLFLDPACTPCLKTTSIVCTAKHMVNRLLFEKFGFVLDSVATKTRIMQTDSSSCGLFVCLYAKMIANNEDMCPSIMSIFSISRHIFEAIAGNCLIHKKYNKQQCPLCKDQTKSDWIECTRCKQWLHCQCAGVTIENAKRDDFFVCP